MTVAKRWGAIGAVAAVAVLVVFHPSRPLYMENRDVEVTVDDGVVLRGTISKPRWSKKPVPGIVLVHGSGPLTREHVRGDMRRLVRLGFAVLAYDKRGAGDSSGTYMRGSATPADVLLRRLAADAAAMFDALGTDQDVDARASGYFGASQAGWIIPVAAEQTAIPPRFEIILSGPAVSTGVEQYYSDLTGDGHRPPRIADTAEVERLVTAFDGDPGFDPLPFLSRSRVPTLWLLGDRDLSVPTFATARALEALPADVRVHHTVVRFPDADHGLRDAPVWTTVSSWMNTIGVGTP